VLVECWRSVGASGLVQNAIGGRDNRATCWPSSGPPGRRGAPARALDRQRSMFYLQRLRSILAPFCRLLERGCGAEPLDVSPCPSDAPRSEITISEHECGARIEAPDLAGRHCHLPNDRPGRSRQPDMSRPASSARRSFSSASGCGKT
jgi:hypothetical protein